ncbi:hypothetical protein SPRG_11504 [Saprolegnia parasitica CBS 223.65]|uniref:COX assembly mitochondrial protein n=1 Tax=Saprolegnia parasitica (strain CBS 223.65) TaxID=695850 RepID=A0A067CA38_SAPPC|nr:hypothetical protein SPRG_11504 [Saprolegnia parasitica CBS 223.65]KDO23411.1 hypothetical protein SPRG_11504 [Saprolegnia parasitica CBS 223.65]|eukprot:XP_012205899.1 hypothetical protein SPRG_11504 [Saprolegnia parasitica CBS 223.65]
MHSSLDRPHPECQEIVDALRICHEENPLLKFGGACNDIKAALNQCFAKETHHRRKINLEKARKFNKIYEEDKDERRKASSSA